MKKKTAYGVRNWKEYNAALVKRGSLLSLPGLADPPVPHYSTLCRRTGGWT